MTERIRCGNPPFSERLDRTRRRLRVRWSAAENTEPNCSWPYATKQHYKAIGKDWQRISVQEAAILVFSAASRTLDSGRMGVLQGYLLDTFRKIQYSRNPLGFEHVKPPCSFHWCSRDPAIDEGKVLKKAMSTLIGIYVDTIIAIDSNDLMQCRYSIGKSIRGNVDLIRYQFETRHVDRKIWVPCTTNLSTDYNRFLCQPLQLVLFSGEIPIDFSYSQIRNSEQSARESTLHEKRKNVKVLLLRFRVECTLDYVLVTYTLSAAEHLRRQSKHRVNNEN